MDDDTELLLPSVESRNFEDEGEFEPMLPSAGAQLLHLPDELLLYILSFLDFPSCRNCSLSCHKLYTLIQDPSLNLLDKQLHLRLTQGVFNIVELKYKRNIMYVQEPLPNLFVVCHDLGSVEVIKVTRSKDTLEVVLRFF